MSKHKQVFIIFSDYPFGTNKMSEKLRLAVGMSLCDENILNLVFLGNSRHALNKIEDEKSKLKPISKHIEMLSELEVKFYVESGDGFSHPEKIGYQKIETNQVDSLIEKADVVIH